MADTIFAKIIAKQIPATIVYEDEQALAFRDIGPKAPVHILVIPKKEIARIADATAADEALLGRLLTVANEVARNEGIDKSGYRLVINNGKDAGESVPHLHVHLLGGRALTWPPG
ncbi:MAG: histidine triad nucleotide-binding protein [Verrucomicrobia bacterium]|nr:histidine triad nucleotide-binding protein [Verrucomicrobiota bacterium]